MIEEGFDVEASADWIRTEKLRESLRWRPKLTGLELSDRIGIEAEADGTRTEQLKESLTWRPRLNGLEVEGQKRV